MAMRVAVIGAGPCGLMALKNLKEEGFDVTVFEARDWIGGIWQYSTDSALSVAESTIFNSSRFRSSISDYPFDDDVDDFPTWQQMHRYLKGYCDQFDLHRHIQLGTRVTNLSRDKGRWVVDVASKDGPVRHEKFDKVIVAIGTFVKPKTPKILGIEKFEGPALHAVEFNTPSKYDGQNVLLVGLHATAQDVAKTLEGHAKKLYLAHKNGLILVRVTDESPYVRTTLIALNSCRGTSLMERRLIRARAWRSCSSMSLWKHGFQIYLSGSLIS